MDATTPTGSRRIMLVKPGRYSPAIAPVHGARGAREESEHVGDGGYLVALAPPRAVCRSCCDSSSRTYRALRFDAVSDLEQQRGAIPSARCATSRRVHRRPQRPRHSTCSAEASANFQMTLPGGRIEDVLSTSPLPSVSLPLDQQLRLHGSLVEKDVA